MKHLQQVTEFFSDGIQSVSSVALMRLFHCIRHPGDQNLASEKVICYLTFKIKTITNLIYTHKKKMTVRMNSFEMTRVN